MFTKEEILERYAQTTARSKAMNKGESFNLAMIIAGCAHFAKAQRSGEDFTEHPHHVASQFDSKNKRIIALLHDVIEDSEGEWTLEDLRTLGFSERILTAVDAITMRPGEKYFDFIERCSLAGEDAIEVKIADLKHNMDPSRYRHIEETPAQTLKAKAYNVAYHYLVDILKVRADPAADYNAPGRSIFEYMRSRDPYWKNPVTANRLLDEYSSRPERLDARAMSGEFRLAVQ